MIRREEECTPSSSWWEDVQHHHHNDHVSTSFYHIKTNDPNANTNANARCHEEDELSISMANPSNHLGLTTVASTYRQSLSVQDQSASSSNHLFQDHVVSSHNHPWNLAFLPSRSLGDQIMDHNHNHHHHHITSSTNSSEIPFEPPNDNGNGNGWMYNTKQVRYNQSNEQRLSKLCDHVGKYWSINNGSSQALEVKSEESLDLCYTNNGLSVNGLMLSNQLRNINHSFKPLSLSEFTKKDNKAVSQVIVKSATTNAGKKKRYEENFDEVSKKAKYCGKDSTLSPEKELPKAKLREKITTLQQIVSPFGKTDTASVLQETITYINFYQEQIKLLSTPYMKNPPTKDHEWGGWERGEEKRRQKIHLDLRSRGLCLVPICYTPIAYHHHHDHDHHHHHQHHTPNHYWTTSSTPSFYR